MRNGIASLTVLALAFGLTAGHGGTAPGPVAADQQSAPASQAACDPAKTVGVWVGARYSMEVLANGTYHASGTPNMASIDVTGTLKLDRCSATFVDTSGRFACPAVNVGRYTFSVSDTTIAFILVADPCDGRRIPLTAGSLTRRRTK